ERHAVAGLDRRSPRAQVHAHLERRARGIETIDRQAVERHALALGQRLDFDNPARQGDRPQFAFEARSRKPIGAPLGGTEAEREGDDWQANEKDRWLLPADECRRRTQHQRYPADPGSRFHRECEIGGDASAEESREPERPPLPLQRDLAPDENAKSPKHAMRSSDAEIVGAGAQIDAAQAESALPEPREDCPAKISGWR